MGSKTQRTEFLATKQEKLALQALADRDGVSQASWLRNQIRKIAKRRKLWPAVILVFLISGCETMTTRQKAFVWGATGVIVGALVVSASSGGSSRPTAPANCGIIVRADGTSFPAQC